VWGWGTGRSLALDVQLCKVPGDPVTEPIYRVLDLLLCGQAYVVLGADDYLIAVGLKRWEYGLC
jgi:hypothetical protein